MHASLPSILLCSLARSDFEDSDNGDSKRASLNGADACRMFGKGENLAQSLAISIFLDTVSVCSGTAHQYTYGFRALCSCCPSQIRSDVRYQMYRTATRQVVHHVVCVGRVA